MLRPTNPADVLSLLVMQARTESVAAGGRRSLVSGRERSLPWGGMVAEWMLASGRRRTWVLSLNGIPSGVVSCCPYKGRGIWEIDYLRVAPGKDGAPLEMLESLGLALGALGAERMVLRLALDSPLHPAVMDAGFAPIMRERLYRRETASPAERAPAEASPSRLAAEADMYELYRLYTASVPTPVRQLEGMTLGDWGARRTGQTFQAERRWVQELEGKIAAAVTVMRGRKDKLVDILTNPRCPARLDYLVGEAVQADGGRARLLCLLPEYLWLREAEDALEHWGFNADREITLYVRPVMARVKNVGLMPARA